MTRALARLALFAFGIGITLAYGRLGFMPLDQSIVFDGGWRILSGQLPYSDFLLPAGLVPAVLQAAAFKLLGVSWFAYCLHAAIVNGLFAVIVFSLLRDFQLRAWLAVSLALCSAVVLYPPFGVPYPDQHSFFFAAATLLATRRAIAPSAASNRWMAGAVLLGALAFFSKPVPAAFVVLPCGVALTWVCWRRGLHAWRALGAGVLLVAIPMAALIVIGRVDPRTFAYSAIELPLATAQRRTAIGEDLAKLLAGLRSVTLATPWLVHAVGALVLLRRRDRRAVGLWLLAEGLLLACALFVFVTNNEVVNGMPYLFVAAGLAVAAITTTGGRRAAALVSVAAVLLCGADAWRFNRRVNATRIVHDQYWDEGSPRWSPGGRLSFMTLNDRWRATDLRPILSYVAQRPDNFFLLGDSAVLYGATGHPSVLPGLWLHPGLTTPPEGSAAFTAFERTLEANLASSDVRYVIVEAPQTLMGVSLDTFPSVLARTTGCARRMVGSWTVIDICRPPAAQ